VAKVLNGPAHCVQASPFRRFSCSSALTRGSGCPLPSRCGSSLRSLKQMDRIGAGRVQLSQRRRPLPLPFRGIDLPVAGVPDLASVEAFVETKMYRGIRVDRMTRSLTGWQIVVRVWLAGDECPVLQGDDYFPANDAALTSDAEAFQMALLLTRRSGFQITSIRTSPDRCDNPNPNRNMQIAGIA
jgi:hypothetical protein